MKTAQTAARRLALRRLLQRQEIRSQAQAVKLLGHQGYRVSLATVSRDLAAIGVARGATENAYHLLEQSAAEDGNVERLRRVLESYLLSVASSGNLVVIRTPPAAAGPVAAALDGAGVEGLLGTLAGDDTVLAVSAEGEGGAKLEEILLQILEEGP